MKEFILEIKKISKDISKNHISAYAAQSAFFFVLSMIPIILLLFSIVQYTPVTKADVMEFVIRIFPEQSMQDFISNILNEVYGQSRSIIPVTIIGALWSAGRGVLAINGGLNQVYCSEETRNYLIVRIRASFYTIIFIASIVFGLVLSVFGKSLIHFIDSHFHIFHDTLALILHMGNLTNFIVVFLFALLVYQYLPNRKTKLLKQVPGAIVASISWLIISYIFSIYLEIFRGFEGLYGSMAALIMVMLWLYFSMYTLLLGGMVNEWLRESKEMD